jgi:hypothetical protein
MNHSALVPDKVFVKPPTLHWAIVLLLSIATFGLFAWVWMLRQARFVRRIDPSNKSTMQIAMGFALVLFSILLTVVNSITVARGGESTDLGITGTVMYFFVLFMLVSAYLEIRKTLTSHYGIPMNAILTVIFNVYYVQYHLSRIAKLQPSLVNKLPNDIHAASEAGQASA